jgi:hypothetical protein
MKNKSIIMKILVIGSILLTLLLLVVVFSLIKMLMPKKENIVEKKIITKNYTLEEVENIIFDFKKANSNFIITDEEELVIIQNSKEEKFHLNYKEKGSNIYLEEDSFIINPQKKKYTVYIPKNYIGKITIINGFGEVQGEDIVNDLYINNNAGSLTLKNSGNIKLKDVSGEISLENIEGILEIESSTGNIKINNMIGNINVESITGDIEIMNFSPLGDSKFENVSGDIILKIVENSVCKIVSTNESGKTKISDTICADKIKVNEINVTNVTGMIKID